MPYDIRILHNAARHYCMTRAAEWHRRYADPSVAEHVPVPSRPGEWDYSAEARNILPRYQILAAIQHDIETTVSAATG